MRVPQSQKEMASPVSLLAFVSGHNEYRRRLVGRCCSLSPSTTQHQSQPPGLPYAVVLLQHPLPRAKNGDWQGSRSRLRARPAPHTALYKHAERITSWNYLLETGWTIAEQGWRRESHQVPQLRGTASRPSPKMSFSCRPKFSLISHSFSDSSHWHWLPRALRWAPGALCINCMPCLWHIMLCYYFFFIYLAIFTWKDFQTRTMFFNPLIHTHTSLKSYWVKNQALLVSTELWDITAMCKAVPPAAQPTASQHSFREQPQHEKVPILICHHCSSCSPSLLHPPRKHTHTSDKIFSVN